MPVGNIIKFITARAHYKAFKAEMHMPKEFHPFEIPGKGLYVTAEELQAFYANNDLSDETLSNYDPAQKLFVTHE